MTTYLQAPNGEYISLTDWAARLDLPYSTFHSRWKKYKAKQISRKKLLRPRGAEEEKPKKPPRIPVPTEPRGKKVYAAWCNIKQRCLNPFSPAYKTHGAVGILIHPSWEEDFHQFVQDVGYPRSLDFILRRIDKEGHFEPGNVEWVPLRGADSKGGAK